MTQTIWKLDILKLSSWTTEALAHCNKGELTETQTEGRTSKENCQSRISSSVTRMEPIQHVHVEMQNTVS